MTASARDDTRQGGTIWVMNLDASTDGSKDEPAPVIAATFRRDGLESADALAGAMGSAAAEVHQRFETGRSCYTAWVDSQLAAYGWVSFDEEHIGELDLRLRLLPGEAYIWDCFTLPAFRRKRLFSALLVHIVRELQAGCLDRVWIGANLENVASQRGIARAGFLPVADLIVARALALRRVWVQGRPGVPESLVAEARRAFLGDRDRVWLEAAATVKLSQIGKPDKFG